MMKELFNCLADYTVFSVCNLAYDLMYGRKHKEKEMPKKEVYQIVLKGEEVNLPESVVNEIEKEDHDLSKTLLFAKAKNSEKLIRYAMYYMTDVNAVLMEATDSEKEFINTIAELAGYGKIYESSSSLDLSKFDINNINIKNEFIISIFDIKSRLGTEEMQEKIRLRKEYDDASKEHPEDDSELLNDNTSSIPYDRMDEDGMIHPVFFGNENLDIPLVPKQGYGISNELFERLENEIGTKYLKDKDYRYELNPVSGMIDLIVSSTFYEDRYNIDPGIIIGGDKICVLANTENDTIFVPATQEEILTKVFGFKLYRLTPEEIQKIWYDDFFKNTNIYRFIDMSNTGFIAKLSNDEFDKLGKKLTFIINKLKESGNHDLEIPRFRFNHFTSVDDFIIISDFSVKSPLADIGETSPTIYEGMMFIVEGDNVSCKFRENITQFKIEKYNEL